ncbi:hypothetical protein CR513_19000, partial [Mucuna pruriens]
MENQGHAVNIPYLFKGQNYEYWKQRIIAFFDAYHIDTWNIVENGNYIPTKKDEIEIIRSSWSEDKKRQEAEYKKVHSCNSRKRYGTHWLKPIRGHHR